LLHANRDERIFPAMDAIAEPVLFDATLKPNPPMSAPVLKAVVAVAAALNFSFGLYFVSRGAWPVTPFMGADVVLLAWALNATYRAAKRSERLKLTPRLLRVERHPARGEPDRIELNPYWIRVDLEEPVQSSSRLMLASHGRAVQIGAFLPPDERLSVAKALRAALARARGSRFE
jgi:uncharacterized membrane protein